MKHIELGFVACISLFVPCFPSLKSGLKHRKPSVKLWLGGKNLHKVFDGPHHGLQSCLMSTVEASKNMLTLLKRALCWPFQDSQVEHAPQKCFNRKITTRQDFLTGVTSLIPVVNNCKIAAIILLVSAFILSKSWFI